MLISLARLVRRKLTEISSKKAAPADDVIADEQTPIYKELAMTEELREAIFPKTPQMVSAVFERPLPPLSRPPAPPPASDGKSFPIIF